jgi:SAM-dependent methyltransferase
MTEPVQGHLYDFPEYYDLVFAADNADEFEFLQACFTKHSKRTVQSIFEPACGTGRLLLDLVQSGFEVAGLDLNEKAVDYCNQQFKRHGYPESAFVADMAEFKLPKKYDAAFNFINSFRHLTTEELALKHLKLMAEVIEPGGLYCLGLHLIPDDYSLEEYDTEEEWSASKDGMTVTTRLWSDRYDPKTRIESIAFEYHVETPAGKQVIRDEMNHLCYTYKQMNSLLKKIPEFTVAATYDFLYDIEDPIKVDGETQDVVYVLVRK